MLPKKGELIKCVASFNNDVFWIGCGYRVERVDSKNGYVYVYNDEGDLTRIDYPHDVSHGRFEINA